MKKIFYDHIKEKDEITWYGGFYVTNGILNYKKRTSRPKSCEPLSGYINTEEYNRNNMPVLKPNIHCGYIHQNKVFNIKENMKNKFVKGLLAAFMVMTTVLLSSCERIDAGFEGIKVNLYGDDKGIGDIALVTGRVFYNPVTTAIYEYETYVKTVDYPAFTINAKDGSEFIVDPTISLKLVDGKSPEVFKKYRKELNEVIEGTLFNYVRDAFRIQLNNFTTDYIVSNRDSIERAIETHLSAALLKENFQLEQLTSGLKYPQTIVDAANAKNKAVQDAMKVENEIRAAEAQAKKLIVAAEAEYKANELKTKALTPAILEQMWIDKWDGKLPIYGQVPTLFKNIGQ